MHNKDACSSSNGGVGTNIATSGHMQSNGAIYGAIYSTLFSDTPSLSATDNGDLSLHSYEGNSPLKYNDSPIQSHLYDSCAIQNHQDMVNRHSMCLNRLAETSKEVEALRQENSQLRAVNRELNNQLSLLIQVSVQNQLDGSSGHTEAFDVINGFRGLRISDNFGDGKENCENWNKDQEVSNESPTSVIENNVEVERFSLPKSISVRSNGYLKAAQPTAAGASNGSRPKGAARPRTSLTPSDVVQKVYVRGGKKEEEPLEMVVYNQGMFKTELCNKWQETGTCPYKDQCQFAHGIGELRPVIRHPRYKTEVCRMVLAGVVCPYGHRCHFRHALTEQEKAIAQPKPRPMNLHR
ncbi:zinc finger CCCH domain-containing protein 15-like [Neltuma alba]|uniref:zinc finger CCCH domain-containing protein 15-like n=1 Tax=Neltuma alba TaxID=207710 RepID=UPI0010A44B8A|nr:zinc finger CCCH domain-containing protein 15-like [Prosopis alba]XP_028794486.1 zinc finger CCCH domain-containing protein 15-like [Prosopis alba]